MAKYAMVRIRESLIWLGIFLVVIFVLCTPRSAFDALENGDFGIVSKGTFRGTTIFLRDGGAYKETVDSYRAEIEAHDYLLPMITKKYYPVLGKLTFVFKYAIIDQDQGMLILRYFARVLDHPVYAGYQIQFVFQVESNNCSAIYVSEVPLE